MIKKMRIKNFKCYGPQGADFNLSRINFIFGDNSSGKSSFLKFVKLVSLSLGNGRLSFDKKFWADYLYRKQEDLRISAKLRVQDEGVVSDDGETISFSDTTAGAERVWDFVFDKDDAGDMNSPCGGYYALKNEEGALVAKKEFTLAIPGEVSHMEASRPEVANRLSMDHFSDSFGVMAELDLNADVEQKANDILKRLGLRYRFDKRKGELIDEDFGIVVNLTDLGAGIHELTKTALALASWNKINLDKGLSDVGGILELEEPETHLNEKQMAPLMQVLIEEAKKRPHGQMVIECHSELMFLELRNQLAHGKVKPEDVSVNVVEKTPEGSRVTHIPLDDCGNILKPWPGGLFPERMRIADSYFDET